MFNLKFLLILCLACFGISHACEISILNLHADEIKVFEESEFLRNFEGRLYIDSELLTVNSNGMFVMLGTEQFKISELHHDFEGYFLGDEACISLGAVWGCCKCNGSNPYWQNNCGGCGKRRCGK